MNANRLLVVLVLLLLNSFSTYSQSKSNKTDILIKFGNKITDPDYDTLKFSKVNGDLSDILAKVVFPQFKLDDIEYDPKIKKFNLDKHTAIILVRYTVSLKNNSTSNYSNVDYFIFAANTSSSNSTTYLLNIHRIVLVFVDATVFASNINITKNASFFEKSFQDAVTFVLGAAVPRGKAPQADNPIRLVDFRKIQAPSLLSFAVPIGDKTTKKSDQIDPDYGKRDTVKIQVHELNKFAFTIGINASILNKQSFALKGDTVNVNLDSAQKKQLSNALSIAIEYYPAGRDIDNFLPIWKDLSHFYDHLGLTAGISISKDPLQSYYLGGAISVTKYFSISLGCNWTNQINNGQSLGLSTFSSISSLSDYFHRSYNRIFYFGISLSPSVAIKDLTSKSN